MTMTFVIRAVILSAIFVPAAARAVERSPISRNDAVELTVTAFRMADRYGPVLPAEGRKFLVVATEWRNLVPTQVIAGTVTPTPYLVPVLSDQLFLVVNGGKIAPFATAAQGRPGTLPLKQFTVSDPQSPTRGNMVFDVPADATDLQLVFLDERYGAMSARLSGEEKPRVATLPTGQNELVEVFVAGQRTMEDKTGSGDTELIAVDLRFKSIYQPDKKAKCGKLVRWADWQDYLQLLVDGTYAVTPLSGPLDAQALILPEVSTGGEFVFRVPMQRLSVDLAMYFAEMPSPAGGKVRPKPITWHLAGKAPDPASQKPVVKWKDAFFAGAVLEQRAETIADTRSLVLTFEITNVAKTWEFFQPLEQLSIADSTGKTVKASAEASGKLPWAVGGKLLLPPEATRTFQIAYPVDAKSLRLNYASADPNGSATIPLPEQEAEPAVAGVAPTTRALKQVDDTAIKPIVPASPAPPVAMPPPGNPPAAADKPQPTDTPQPADAPPTPVATQPATLPAPSPTTAPARRFCIHCGQKLVPAAKFCTSCGKKVGP